MTRKQEEEAHESHRPSPPEVEVPLVSVPPKSCIDVVEALKDVRSRETHLERLTASTQALAISTPQPKLQSAYKFWNTQPVPKFGGLWE